jgi:hypothetical protein
MKGVIKMKTKKRGFSKNLLIADYVVTIIFIVAFFICSIFNGLYVMETTNELIATGIDVSMITITPPFNLDGFGVFFSAWIAQLGVSSYAYYSMTKSEHRVELPIQLLENLPDDIKERIEMTDVITTVLTSSDN